MSNAIVARFLDGKIIKGTSFDVDPARPVCHVRTADKGMMEVALAELKALYFVKSLPGNAAYNDLYTLDRTDPRQRGATPIEIRFKDGERLVGFTGRYPPTRSHFFVLPADLKSNNIRVLVNREAVESIKAANRWDRERARVSVRIPAAALFALILLPLPLAGQNAVVTRNVNLRTGPATTYAIIRLLRPPDEVLVLDPQKRDGYYEVRTAGGTHGWVWSRNMHITEPRSPALSDSQPGGPPEIYRGCPLEGSALSQRYRASNRLKNRLTAPGPTAIDSSATLPALLTRGQETDWSDTRGATITGYVLDVKEGGEETVNCGATDVRYRDTHIEVVRDSAHTQATARMIVEVTPRWRAYMAAQGLDWSTAALQQHLTGRWVRFTGWLFWDFSHADEAELTDPGSAHNWRATAWEIHPVTAITVCPAGPQGCD